MPRIKSDEERAADAAVAVDNGNAPETPRRERVLRPRPDGVTIGLLDQPRPIDPPIVARFGSGEGRGRKVDEKTLKAIELMVANPGQWYELGTFMSPSVPAKGSAFGKAGVKFAHVPNGDGTFTRSGCIPVPVGAPTENATDQA